MSPTSKSKSKDKRVAVKEPQNSTTKTTSNSSTGGGVPASGYNPLLGTFHTLDTTPLSSAPPHHINGEDHVEYDSLSNNGSWSGESEDHKDKTSQGPTRQDTIPGVDNDKREKIRQKNEKKHQRQKERRAQELHERCSGYLMSRKLEALAHQLVVMGFSSERATMALILNEGRVEQSVAWLFEGVEDAGNQREHNLDGGGNLKIDISEELAQITEMEMKFKCSKQEVERAIVTFEGDLEQAAETLKVQKQEHPAALPKLEETGDSSSIVGNSKLSSISRTPSKHTSIGAIPIQQKTNDRDFNYTKMGVTVGPPGEPGIKSLQLLKKIPPNLDWTEQQQAATPSVVEKRWAVGGSNPSVSYSLASPLHAAKTESRNATDLKNLKLGSVRETVIVMQRPKSKTVSSSSLSDWHPNAVDPLMNMNPNGFSTRSYGSNVNTQFYDQFQYQQQQQYASSSGPLDHHYSQQGGMWNRTTTPTLAAASSLGLFSGSSGPSSPVDWNAGGSVQFDYTNIDWSLDRLPHSNSRANGMWMGWGSSSSGNKSATRPISNGNNRLHPDGSEASGGEWTSPFEEKELFCFPRRFVSSPSLL